MKCDPKIPMVKVRDSSFFSGTTDKIIRKRQPVLFKSLSDR